MKFLSILAAASLALAPAFASAGSGTESTDSTDNGRPVSGPLAGRSLEGSPIPAAAIVLGLMGWVGIPLDVMTITIAAITIGIAVDNGIHYIFRFREEFAISGDYQATLHVCHANIGRAVFYTSATVILGFSILTLSNFWPTIYFGILTGLAMLIAFLASLTLLPLLILIWKPFGPGRDT